jgi:hypothetical protein
MHMMRRLGRAVAMTTVAALVVSACGGDDTGQDAGDTSASASAGSTIDAATSSATDELPAETPAPTTATTPATTTPATDVPTEAAGDDGVREVPGEYDTIQSAVDAAVEGDLVLIAPGTYNEAVDVVTNNLTIRGLDRDGVVLDGQLELDNGIRVLGASGVAVENLTAQNYTANGVFFTSVTGYRASYINTYRTGDYGIYAFDSVTGQIDHAHTVGSKDAGVYIGQCYPCDAVITDVLSEHNGLGYSGTNSGGNLLIVNSTFRNNRAGIVPNSGSYELCYPERETTIAGNLVYSNNQTDTPAIEVALLAQGNGILIAGGVKNTIVKNRVLDHNRTGIGLVPFLEEDPNDDLPTDDEWSVPCAEQKNQAPAAVEGALLWDSKQNVVTDNVVSDSREADLAVASAGGDISTFGNCFAGNDVATTAPLELQALAPCEGTGAGDWAAGDLDVARWLAEIDTLPGEVDWREAPLPDLGTHEGMADAATAPARPATDVPMSIDLDAITVPDAPA